MRGEMKLAVVCAEAPEPRETFLRRDIAALRTRFDVRVFGLARRLPTLAGATLLRAFPPRAALSLALRLRTVREIADYVADDGAILAHFAWTTADVAAVASRLSGRPWFCFVHAWDVFTRPAGELRRRTATASHVVACSQAAADACAAAGIPPAKITVIHHALPDFSTLRPCDLATDRPAATRPFTTVAVGRLVEKKGFDILLHAWPAVRDARPGARLRIIGDGPCAPSLHRLADEVDAPGGAVEFAGALPENETLQAIAAADLLVLPSRRLANGDRDGIPNAVLEAMALGVPVVTTDAGAAGEVVADGATGLLLPSPATPEALASAIARLARDGALRATLSRNAAALVRERFTAAGYLDAVSNCLQSANSSSIILP